MTNAVFTSSSTAWLGFCFLLLFFSFLFSLLSFHFFLKIWVCVSEKQILSYLLEILYEFLVAAVANYYKLGGWNQLEYTFSFLEGRSLKSVPSAGNGGVRRWFLERILPLSASGGRWRENCSVVSCPTLCYPMDFSPWNSPGQNTGVGGLSLGADGLPWIVPLSLQPLSLQSHHRPLRPSCLSLSCDGI